MRNQVALVIGPTGATGGPIAAALARRSGWRVYGMSRNPPSGEVQFTHIAADLTDPVSCRRALATIDPVTHVFFAARAPLREGGVDDVEGNVVARHGSEPRSLESLASWEFADFVFGTEWDLLTDTGRLRRAGFMHASIPSP
jgi:NAD(P)-dependent dehydrogenase (short-subunit alcohol dehydrogenase family)